MMVGLKLATTRELLLTIETIANKCTDLVSKVRDKNRTNRAGQNTVDGRVLREVQVASVAIGKLEHVRFLTNEPLELLILI